MSDLNDPRGKHLLGEAVRLLVQSGATGVAIADFIAQYTVVLKETLVAQPAPVQLELKEQVKGALLEALQELSLPSQRTAAGRRRQISVYVDQAKTSLSLSEDLLDKVTASTGSPKETRQLIHRFANSKPVEHPNRSAWVAENLEQHLLLTQVLPQLTSH